ncbi:zinc finger 862-like [Paramuricea clavata]|uniref:Zinc finger 862-like n=1 Tax=Paramuricea clavata TaxID=317549 RepID=A0A7D9HXL3_PARCT|nr:zinc finger 862-like [Paramuricea clavata]
MMSNRVNDTNEGTPCSKKSRVKPETVKNWVTRFDKEFQTFSWLDYSTEKEKGINVVTQLKCKICKKYRKRITGCRNFSDKWVVGASSVKTSSVREHAMSDQHVHAMNVQNKEFARSEGKSLVPREAPIIQALENLSNEEQERMKIKFDVAYLVATEQMAFSKYPSICALEIRHGVDIGQSYLNANACKEFVHCIADIENEDLISAVAQAKFFSLLIDGSTDKSNADNEATLVVWFDPEDIEVESLDGDNVDDEAIDPGVVSRVTNTNSNRKLVGIGTDGASSNVAARGLKGLVEQKLPWIFWMWCLAHRLELAIKDALRGTFFDSIDEMLLRLYYVYEKSPKKCIELESLCADLKECLEFDEDGIRPVRASGTRWVSHKVKAMKRVLSKYGAYIAHLTSLSEDKSVKAADRAKLKGYLKKWVNAKYILGCAAFVDLLTPCATFSKSMQSNDLDILAAISHIIKTLNETNKLTSKPLEQWKTYSDTLKKVQQDEKGQSEYQTQILTNVEGAKTFLLQNSRSYCNAVTTCIKSRLSWSDLQHLRDIILVLATVGWEKVMDKLDAHGDQEEIDDTDREDPLNAIDRLVEAYKVPLEGAGAEVDQVRVEFEAMMAYAVQFISLSTLDYQSVWWRMFHAPDKSEWSNILILASLLFSLPASNGTVERVFSQLNCIKTKKRASLSSNSLDDLLTLCTGKRKLDDFSPDRAVRLWWHTKHRRPNQSVRKQYVRRNSNVNRKPASTSASTTSTGSNNVDSTTTDSDSGEEQSKSLLDDWDHWMRESDDSDEEL